MNRITDEFRRDSHKSPAELEREIDATRAELELTLEELEHRLSPTDIVTNLMTRLRREGGELAENLGHSVKENPLPALLTSVGIAWMMASSGRHHDGHATHERRELGRSRMRESAEDLGERWREAKGSMRRGRESAREGLDHARDMISDSASSARQRGRELTSQMRRGTRRARSGLEHLWHEQPLVLGVLGLAAGAIAGAALPSTEQEDEMLGPMRDRALARAKERGARSARHLRKRAKHTVEDAKRSMSGESNDGGDSGWTPEEARAREAGAPAQHEQRPG